MTYWEELLRIKPIPDVEEAVYKLINAGKDAIAWFGGEMWYEDEDGERIIFEEIPVVEEQEEVIYDENYEEPVIIERISGMPLISLYFFTNGRNQWFLLLWLEVPNYSEIEDVPSMYTMFYQSRYRTLFEDRYTIDGNVNLTLLIDKDVDVAIGLISYYIQYYDYADNVNIQISYAPE